jgi:DNA polymerase III epsilon subunit family exonuclease
MGNEGELGWVEDAAWPGDEDVRDRPLDPDAVRVQVEMPEPAALRAAGSLAAQIHVERRRARHPAAAAWDIDLDAARYCVIDTETTGTGAAGGDEILEIGAVRVTGGELAQELASLVRPHGPIGAAAYAVHGIAFADVVDAPRLEAVLPSLQEIVRGCVLVFHNAPFDLGFLQRALQDADREPLASPVVDTLLVARALLGGPCGLGRVAARLGIVDPHVHRALPDARLTAKLWLELEAMLRRGGARTIADVPGARPHPPRARRRRGPAPGALVARLEAAIQRGEALRVACRLVRGIAPVELRIRPLRIQSGLCVARDLDRCADVAIEVARIESLRREP